MTRRLPAWGGSVVAVVGLLSVHPIDGHATFVAAQTKSGTLIRTERGPTNASLGSGVAISTNTAVVGGGNSVYIYTRAKGRWPRRPTTVLNDPDTTDGAFFGYAVAISGSTLVVGAFVSDNLRGEAYIYVKGNSGWSTTPVATLADPDANPSNQDFFGVSVATSGSTVAVGALGYEGFYGATYLYVDASSGWPTAPTETLVDPSPEGGDFGISVTLSAETLCVGAEGTDSGQGGAYLYQEGPSGWPTVPNVVLADPGATTKDYFGASVALTTSGLVVGADGTDAGAGAAYLYTKNASDWLLSPTATFIDPSASAADQFGQSVALSGGTIVVGAENKTTYDGSAYLYTRHSKAWPSTPTRTLSDPGGSADGFGTSVAISPRFTVVGAWKTDSGAGAAYIYKG
jgi:hypothetical protein